MMKWYDINSSSPESARNVVKSLKKQRLMVRRRDGHIYVCASTVHQTWLHGVCRDFGVSLIALEEAPPGERIPKKEEYIMPCGEKVYDPLMVGHHMRWCKKCKSITEARGKAEGVPTPTTGPTSGPTPTRKTIVVAKLEPGQNFDLSGVIVSLEVLRDKYWIELDKVDKVLESLRSYKEIKDKLAELGNESKMRLNAARQLLIEGKI